MRSVWTLQSTVRIPESASTTEVTSKAAVTLLRDLQELAQHEDQAQAFARRFAGYLMGPVT
jgi:hypothetical protein